ncbi:hypothetical protein ACHAQJ_001747 [Trichoderma viride]
MPRAGYDLTGAATGSPASEAAARARQRTATGNRTPRAGTPANPSRPDGDDQVTPRASRIGISAVAAHVGPLVYSQMNLATHDARVFQIQGRPPRQELYQNPLNLGSIQAASQPMARPINVQTPFGAANFGTADSGVQQAQQLWSSGQFYALPANQHEFQVHHSAYPNPASFVHSQTAIRPTQHRAPGSMSAGASAYHTADEDAEMAGVDNWRR